MKNFLYVFILIGFAGGLSAQEGEEVFKEEGKKNRISMLLGTAFIDRVIGPGEEKEGQFVPTIGLDYARGLTERFSLGIFTDIELSSYFIEIGDQVELERENAAVIVLAGIYEIVERWALEAGYGVELEKNKSFQVIRLGTSYEVPIRNDWDVTLALSFDLKEEYSSWAFAIGFGKSF